MPIVRARGIHLGPGEGPGTVDAVFVDDDERMQGREINGARVISRKELLAEPDRERGIIIAIADPQTRKTIAEALAAEGFRFPTLTDRAAIIMDGNEMGEGGIYCANSMVTSNARIGRMFHNNIYAYVTHETVIGDYVTFSPRVSCGGRVVIEDMAFIGAAAVIRPGKPGEPIVIGAGATVGMGAVVTRSVPPG
ncbi:MAG: acetyltransferase, partial [Alphaproteobacteria bacterium]